MFSPPMTRAAHDFYARLLQSDRPREQLNSSAVATMTASISNQGQVAAHCINYYLAPDQKESYNALVFLAHDSSAAADSKIWVRENFFQLNVRWSDLPILRPTFSRSCASTRKLAHLSLSSHLARR